MFFFILISGFISILYLYTGFRLIPSFFKKKAAFFAWTLLIFLLITLLVHIYLKIHFIYPGVSRISAWIGYTGLGLISDFFCLAFIRDLLIIVSLIVLKIKQAVKKPEPGKIPVFNPERRQFLFKTSTYSIAAMSVSASVLGYTTAFQVPRIVPIHIKTKEKYAALKGMKLVQFTDLHVGDIINHTYVRKVCDKINQLNADLIVFTGDLADGSPQNLSHDTAPLMDLSAPLGKYFVTGNHEYYSGAKRWLHEVKRLGFKPLINTHKIIKYNQGLLTLSGVTDIRAGAFFKDHQSSPQKAIQGCPENSFKLLCAHQPISIFAASKAGFDLQLSGHTHGGQYFPFNYLIKLQQPFVKGLYQFRDTQLYVSQGTGFWGPPIRLGTFPEITLFKFI